MIEIRSPQRHLRVEQLEDRTTPSIVLQGIPDWLPAGPAPATNGQTGPGVTNQPTTGAVEAISPHPTNPNIMFVGSVNGGVWRTNNATDANPAWTPLTDQLPSLSVASMDLNANPIRPQLLVGLGSLSSAGRISGDLLGLLYSEDPFAANPSFRVIDGGSALLANQTFQAVVARDNYLLAAGSNGLYRSLDRANTWTLISGSATLPAGRLIEAVADPSNANRVYVAGANGVFRTDDITAGTPNWINVTDATMQIGANLQNVKIAIHNSAGNNVVWVGTAFPGPNPRESAVQVVWSVNGGVTWTPMDEAVNLGYAALITDVSNSTTNPIQITSPNHGLQTGDRVQISGVQGNLGANGLWNVTVNGGNTFTLNGSAATGEYTGGGTWRKVFGVSPGGQADIHFGLAADPDSPNTVYLSGDRQDAFGFTPNAVGAQDYSGNVMKGDRSQPRGFNAFAPSPQWAHITNNGSGNNGAPHADSRHLVFDAQKNLIEGDDGGIYKRLTPKLTAGNWVSLNGDSSATSSALAATNPPTGLGLGQFYRVQYDTLNGIIFGGEQDTGSVEMTTKTGVVGDNNWKTFQGGDGFWQGVDNTQKGGLNRTFRYSMGNTVEAFVRREFDNTNTQVSFNSVLMASPAKPTTPYDGLDGSDKGSFGLNVYTLNSIDGRMMMLGVNHLYEDNDPNPVLGRAGDVIAKITPTGYAGRTTSIVYGGKQNGAPITRIAWVGTDAGQLWLRGAAGGFSKIATLPGNGGVNQVVTDPDDWRTAYVLRGNNQVYRTTDGGATWVSITENLAATGFDSAGNPIGGLTTAIYSIAVWDPIVGTNSGEEILLAAGRTGVYRYAPGIVDPLCAGGAWIEYGTRLPNAVISDINVYGNTVVVGTQGRGAWYIPDVSTSITSKATVRVNGDGGSNNLSLLADASNPSYIVVSDGVSTVRVERSALQSFEFYGLGGADTVRISANGLPGGDLTFIRYPLTIDLGGDAGDMLIVENKARTTATRVTVTATTIGADTSDNLFSNVCGTLVNYTGLQNGTLRLDLGTNFVGGNQILIRSTSAQSTEIFGTGGSDSFEVNSNAGVDLSGNLSGIGGTLVLNGRGSFADSLTISDQGSAVGNDNVIISNGVVTGFAGAVDGSNVFYNTIEDLTIIGSDNLTLTENFRVQSPSAALTVRSGNGPDAINVRANTLSVAADGGAGNDIIRVSSLAGDTDDGDLSTVNGSVTVDGGAGDNRLIVSNFGRAAVNPIIISGNTIAGASAKPIQYTSTGGRFFASTGDGLQYRGSNTANDSFSILSSLAGSQLAVDGNGGNDIYGIDGESLAGEVRLRGGAGNDSFGMSMGVFGSTADFLRLSGGADRDTSLVTGFENNETANISILDPVTGQVTGLGKAWGFDTLEAFEYDALTGRNNLTITDSTTRSYGSENDQAGGFVYKSNGSTSGEVTIARGAVGPLIGFRNINGSENQGLVINGDPTGTGNFRDTLTVLGYSDIGRGTSFGEFVSANGTDDIFVSDQNVTMRNDTVGFLRTIAIGRVNGRPTIGTLVVRSGTEVGQGDRVEVLPSREVNILVDGGGPTKVSIGDKVSVATTIPRTVVRDDSGRTRVVTSEGSSFSFVNFENANGARRIFAVGADRGGGPRVQVFDARTKEILFDSFVYSSSYTGGVRVAVGDVTGDGVPDLVTGTGIGGGPHIQVFDGVTFDLLSSFFAYEPSFTGGVYLAIGDTDGDGKGEIITGSGVGGGPLVRVFDMNGTDRGAFFAYGSDFRGGVRVAAGDMDGDGIVEIITAAGPGGGPHVRVFDARSFNTVNEYMLLDPNYRGGLFISAGDMDGDGKAEIVVGPAGNERPELTILRSNTGEVVVMSVFDIGPMDSPEPLPAVAPNVLSATGNPTTQDAGLRMSVNQLDDSGKAQVLVGRGAGFSPRVHAYTLDPMAEAFNVFTMDGWEGGIFVG